MKTILHLFKSYKGNQSLLNDIVSSGNGGYRTIACFLGGVDDGSNEMRKFADVVIYLGNHREKIKWSNVKLIGNVVGLIDEEEVDLVVCHTWRLMTIGVLAKYVSNSKPKVVGIFHGVRTSAVTLSKKVFFKIVFLGMDKIVGVSDACVEDISAHFWSANRNKLVSIPNGIYCEPFQSAEPKNREDIFSKGCKNKFIFISVSRLSPVKNLERFILAFHELVQLQKKVAFVVVGAGPLEEKLRILVKEKGLCDYVFFMGFRSNVPELLKSADVFVIPSLREGLSRSLLEAMVSAKPVIASNIDSISEVVDDYMHGRLVNPESKQDILEALLFFVSCNNQELEAMGQSGKSRVLEKYTSRIMKEKYGVLFDSMI